MKSIIRIAAVMSSLALLIGCVWFAQKQATRAIMPGSKSIDTLIDPAVAPSAIMPGSKSGTLIIPTQQPPSPSKTIMPGSKSFTGATTISADALKLQSGKPTPDLMPSSKLGIFRMNLPAPSQKP